MTPEEQQDGVERAIGRIEGAFKEFSESVKSRFDSFETKLSEISGCVTEDGKKIASLEEYRKNSRNKTILTGGISGSAIVGIVEFLKYLIQGHK